MNPESDTDLVKQAELESLKAAIAMTNDELDAVMERNAAIQSRIDYLRGYTAGLAKLNTVQ